MGHGLWRFDDAFDGVHEEWLRDKVGPGACWFGKGRKGHLEMPWGRDFQM